MPAKISKGFMPGKPPVTNFKPTMRLILGYFSCFVFLFSFYVVGASATLSPESLSLPVSPQLYRRPTHPFLFPKTKSTVLPDPSLFFTPTLLSAPLPTNSFFQNFVLKNGDQPEYIHPYLIRSSHSSLSLCYPSHLTNTSSTYQIFKADLTISALPNSNNSTHIITSYSDLSVTLDLPSSNLRFFIVRGSPFLTFELTRPGVALSISTIHTILQFSSNSARTKYTIKFDNKQTWLLYSSSPVNLSHNISAITSGEFSGVIRIAILPDSDPQHEAILDRFSSCYPVAGHAKFPKRFQLKYQWKRRGLGDLLMLAHPLHLRLLDGGVTVLKDFKYKSVDGELVGVVGNSWLMKTDPFPVTWHSIKGIEGKLKKSNVDEIISALCGDVDGLKSLNSTTIPTSSYFFGKLIARAARLALISEEVGYPQVIPTVANFLKDHIEEWLDGTFGANGFLYEEKWGGLVTKSGSSDSTADFGFGIYNDHHFHLGYYIYSIAVLAKIDPAWGMKYKPQAYSLVEDFMNSNKEFNPNYPRLRSFDLWKLHSWAAGVDEFAHGRNQESTSEAVNAYYAAALMGLAYGDIHLASLGSTLLAMEIKAAQTWWHVKEGDDMYGETFSRENRVVGILWANMRETRLWFAPAEWRECRLGIQLLPVLPISEVLFSDVDYVKELVEWTLPALKREGVAEGWKGFVYALEGIYDNEGALNKIRKLKEFDDGNSLSNLLWWIHSRGGEE